MFFRSSRPPQVAYRYRFNRKPSRLRIRPVRPSRYLWAPLHPWSCFLFLLPLLAGYEIGVLCAGGAQPEALRNGADTWLRWGLEAFGLYQLYWAPALLAGFFLVRSCWRWKDRPLDTVGVWLGMAIESVGFALALWGLSRGLGPALDALGVELAQLHRNGPPIVGRIDNPSPTLDGLPIRPAEGDPALGIGDADADLGQVVTFVGAGIYEETLFRLLLYSALVGLLRLVRTPMVLAVLVAALASATLFAAAHHIGPYGEAFDDYVFLFRALAGLFFALLYQLRGFGVAVGTHACYDVLVGVAVG